MTTHLQVEENATAVR